MEEVKVNFEIFNEFIKQIYPTKKEEKNKYRKPHVKANTCAHNQNMRSYVAMFTP